MLYSIQTNSKFRIFEDLISQVGQYGAHLEAFKEVEYEVDESKIRRSILFKVSTNY